MLVKSLMTLLLVAPLVAGAAVYKWVDEDGVVHYGDLPRSKDAQQVQLPKSSVYSPREIEAQDQEQRAAERAAEAVTQIAISQPGPDATVRSNEGNVAVAIDLGAPLEDGRYWTLSIDGQPVGDRQSTTSVTVQNLDRGQHQVQATLFDASGAQLGQSEAVTFHLRRESRLAPNRQPPPSDTGDGTNASDADNGGGDARRSPLSNAASGNTAGGNTASGDGGAPFAPRFQPPPTGNPFAPRFAPR